MIPKQKLADKTVIKNNLNAETSDCSPPNKYMIIGIINGKNSSRNIVLDRVNEKKNLKLSR